MKQFLFILILLVSSTLNAQTNSMNEIIDSNKTDTVFHANLTGEAFIEYRGFKGDQYYFNDWVKSDILLSTGEKLYDIKLKYNGLLDEVIWLNTVIPGLFKIDKASINDFWLKPAFDNTIHFKRIKVNESPNSHHADIFAHVAVEGKISLYIHRKINILEVQSITLDGKLYPYKIIGPTPNYYIKMSSNKYFLMTSLNRNSLLKLFPEQKKLIAKILNTHHLNLKIESDLIKLIGLLNNADFQEK